MTPEKCQSELNDVLRNNPTITFLLDKIESSGCAIDRAKLAVQAGGKAEHVQFALAGHSLTLQSRREEVFDLVANWRWK